MTVLTDRFGNAIDPGVAYARGRIRAGEVDETLRQRHGDTLIRQRFQRHGHDDVYNLTGLIRGFPLAAGDDEWLRSYIQAEPGGHAYLAGPGLAVGGGDLLDPARSRTPGRRSGLVPVEAGSVASFAMTARDGVVTISVTGMPGAACVFRLMMYPDGGRLGAARLLDSARHGFETLVRVLDDPEAARRTILGGA